jgi:hypothetical protein
MQLSYEGLRISSEAVDRSLVAILDKPVDTVANRNDSVIKVLRHFKDSDPVLASIVREAVLDRSESPEPVLPIDDRLFVSAACLTYLAYCAQDTITNDLPDMDESGRRLMELRHIQRDKVELQLEIFHANDEVKLLMCELFEEVKTDLMGADSVYQGSGLVLHALDTQLMLQSIGDPYLN